MPAAKIFLDTNILIYFATDTDIKKRDRAAELLSTSPTISVQVLNEFTSVMRAKLNAPWPAIRAQLDLFGEACEVVSLTQKVQSHAVDIAERYRFAIYDANIIAAAEAAGVTDLYSEDMQNGQRFGRLTILDPFKE